MSEMKLTEPQINILRLYGPDTYCIDLGTVGNDRVRLENMGLLRWVPGQAWSGHYTYGITDAGRALLRSIEKEAQRWITNIDNSAPVVRTIRNTLEGKDVDAQ